MTDKMTLIDVRDWHRGCQQAAQADGRDNAASAHKELADAIDAQQRVNELALAIADHAVRSEIELYAKDFSVDDCRPMYRVDQPEIAEGRSGEDWRSIVSQAIAYIELRGAALPFAMHRSGDVVWFGEREVA